MDRANQVPVRDLPPSVPITYTALAEHGDVPLAIVHHRAITKSITLDCYGVQLLEGQKRGTHMSKASQPLMAHATTLLIGHDASGPAAPSTPTGSIESEICLAAGVFIENIALEILLQLCCSECGTTRVMASTNDKRLCNGIPVDHRLRQFFPSAKPKYSQGVGQHANIIESFGNTMARDDQTYPSKNEAGFAAWLAKPDMQGGLVIALMQPAKTQVYTSDFQWVKSECPSLAYVEESLVFVNGPGGLATTSVFDAFPFITEPISSEGLSKEATDAYDTFLAMLEAKRPEVLFACWRVKGQDLRFSGKGLGRVSEVESLELPSGHVVRVVNGFHPSYAANFCPNESRFRRLFTMELCKAFCELNTAWQEDKWMNILRWKCRDRTYQLMKERGRDGEQLNREDGHLLRGSRRDESARKYKAYTKSFDNGLQRLKHTFEHMVSPEYKSQSSWDLYAFFVFRQDTSEGICDAFLAVSEAMKRFEPGTSIPDSSLVELSNHIGGQTLKFLKDDIPDLLRYPRGLYKNLWRSQFAISTSQGLKWSMEQVTIRFIENLDNSFSESSKSWTYTPDLLHDAFKEIAIDFEESLGKEYDNHRQTRAASVLNSVDNLSASLSSLSLSSSRAAGSATLARSTPPARSSSSAICYNCDQPGHYSSNCTRPKKGSMTPTRSSANITCYNCNQRGHYSPDCTSPKKRGGCFRCGGVGHYANACSVR